MIEKNNHAVENKTQKYERSKELREARIMFSEIAPDGLIGNLEQQLQELQEETKKKLDESKQRE